MSGYLLGAGMQQGSLPTENMLNTARLTVSESARRARERCPHSGPGPSLHSCKGMELGSKEPTARALLLSIWLMRML